MSHGERQNVAGKDALDGDDEAKPARRIGLDAADWVTTQSLDQILTLDDAICRMDHNAPDQAQAVRLRFYAGLSVVEAAKVMDISEATVMRLWRYARAWLCASCRARL